MRGAWNYGIAAAILLLGVATVLADSDHWLPALLGHFRLHIADAALVLALALAVTNFRLPARMALCLSALAIWIYNTNFVEEAMPRASAPAEASDSIVMRVAFANVLATNDDYDLLVAWVRSENVDLLVASEVTDRWLNALEALCDELPHGHNARYGDLAVLSRLPMMRPTENLSIPFARMAAAEVETPIGPITVLSAHPTVPFSTRRNAIRERAFARLGARAVEAPGGVIARRLQCHTLEPAFSGDGPSSRTSLCRRGPPQDLAALAELAVVAGNPHRPCSGRPRLLRRRSPMGARCRLRSSAGGRRYSLFSAGFRALTPSGAVRRLPALCR